MSRKNLKIVYQFLDGRTGRRSDSMCSTVGELASVLQKDYEARSKADFDAEIKLATSDGDDVRAAAEAAKDAFDAFKASYVLVLTEGEETEVDRVSRCPLITFESFIRINEFVE